MAIHSLSSGQSKRTVLRIQILLSLLLTVVIKSFPEIINVSHLLLETIQAVLLLLENVAEVSPLILDFFFELLYLLVKHFLSYGPYLNQCRLFLFYVFCLLKQHNRALLYAILRPLCEYQS